MLRTSAASVITHQLQGAANSWMGDHGDVRAGRIYPQEIRPSNGDEMNQYLKGLF